MLGSIKPEIRIIGFDDAPFTFADKETLVLGVVCRGGTQIDGVVSVAIDVDGMNAAEKMARAINSSPHKDQLKIIMLDGITFGGFNIADINALNKETGLPVIVVIREKPRMKSIKESLSKFKDAEKRWKLIEKAGVIRPVAVTNKVIKGTKTIYYQAAGIRNEDAENVIKLTAVNSSVPEPVRMAHILCSGLKDTRNLK